MRPVKASLFLLILINNNNHIIAMEYINALMQNIELERVYEKVKNFFANDKRVLLYTVAVGLGTACIFDWYKKTKKLNETTKELTQLKEDIGLHKINLALARLDNITLDMNYVWQYIFTSSEISRYWKEHCQSDEIMSPRPHIPGTLKDQISQLYMQFKIENMGFKGDEVLNGFSFELPLPSPRTRNNSPPLRSISPIQMSDKARKASPRNGITRKVKKKKKSSGDSSSGDSQLPPLVDDKLPFKTIASMVPPLPRKRNNSPPLRSGSPVLANDKTKKGSPRNGVVKKTKKIKKKSSDSSSGDSQSPPHHEDNGLGKVGQEKGT